MSYLGIWNRTKNLYYAHSRKVHVDRSLYPQKGCWLIEWPLKIDLHVSSCSLCTTPENQILIFEIAHHISSHLFSTTFQSLLQQLILNNFIYTSKLGN